jgi:kynureninase
MEPTFTTDRGYSTRLDRQDELADFRNRFVIADPDLIYADGNSLGRLTRQTVERMRMAVDKQWGEDLIRGWNAGWYDAPPRVGDKIGRVISAAPGQVIVSDSTSVNLYKLTMAALALRPARTKIVSDELNFPSDLYIMQGCIHQMGNRHRLHIVPSKDGITTDTDLLHDAIDQDTALVSLSQVVFKSGFLYDAEAITKRAHEAGALVLWDLSHAGQPAG